MTSIDANPCPEESSASTGHEGSASSNPAGSAIIGACLVSIAVHVFMFLAMLTLVFPLGAKKPEDLPIAHTEFIGELTKASFMPSPQPDLAQPMNVTDPVEMRFEPKEFEPLSELTTAKKSKLPIIGLGTGGADFSKWGLSAGGGAGPRFFGLGGSARGARRIVYVVDRSGSMLDTFDYVREELKRSVSALRRSQKFHVIFFNSGRVLESPPKRLVSAIEAQKHQLFEFLDGVNPDGGTTPEPALRRAFEVEPDVIYFLTDGEFKRSPMRMLNEWNRDRRVKIFTIAFFGAGGAEILEQIAREHGGEFRHVTEDDLP